MISKPSEHTWVHVQKNTFTNWVNEQLSDSGIWVTDLQEDLHDGVVLARLVESLQLRRIGKLFSQPRNRIQMLQNVDLAFRAIMEDKVKIVNIGNEDVVNGNLKLILGLVWRLIQRYQISGTEPRSAPKKLMINCFRSFLNDMNITNFSSDWSDGIALYALMEKLKPGTCPDWKHSLSSNNIENCRRAMKIAKEKFGVPMVVSAEDFASINLDDLSSMTYLSYFLKPSSPGYNYILDWARFILKDKSIHNLTTDWNDGKRLCAIAYIMGASISGLPTLNDDKQEENCQKAINAAKELNIFCPMSAKEISNPNIDYLSIMSLLSSFRNLNKQRLPNNEKYTLITRVQPIRIHEEICYKFQSCDRSADINELSAELQTPSTFDTLDVFKPHDADAAVSFVPRATGQYILRIIYAEETLTGFPVVLEVKADASRSELTSSAKQLRIGDATNIEINICNSGRGQIRIESKNILTNDLSRNIETTEENAIVIGKFLPDEPGLWKISVLFDNLEIAGSPLIFPVCDPNRVKLYGPKVAKLESLSEYDVDCSLAGEATLTAEAMSNDQQILYDIQADEEKVGHYTISFKPVDLHDVKLNVYYGGYKIPACPIWIRVLDLSVISVSGEGLFRGAIGRAASFDLKAVSNIGELSVDIVQFDGSPIDPVWRKANETDFTFTYVPKMTGTFTVNIQSSGYPIQGSPFYPRIVDYSKIFIVTDLNDLKDEHGRLALESCKETKLEFSTKEAGPGTFTATVLGPSGRLPVTVDLGDIITTVTFIPVKEGDHYVHLYWCGFSLDMSPLLGYCPGHFGEVDSNKVMVTGQGSVEARALVPAEFIIDGRKAGKGKPEVVVRGIHAEIPVLIEPIKYNRYKCIYKTQTPGSYLVYVTWSGVAIPKMPLKVNVTLKGDVSQVRVFKEGLRGSYVGKETKITVDTRDAGPGLVTATCKNSKCSFRCDTIETFDGTFTVSVYPTEAGRFILNVYYDGDEVPGSPFLLHVGEQPDASQVRVQGPGIEDGLIQDFQSMFLVETQGAGAGQLAVRIRGPKQGFKVDMKRESSNDRNIICRYDPTESGHYIINVTWSGRHVPRSPFEVYIFDSQEEVNEHWRQKNELSSNWSRNESIKQWSEDI